MAVFQLITEEGVTLACQHFATIIVITDWGRDSCRPLTSQEGQLGFHASCGC